MDIIQINAGRRLGISLVLASAIGWSLAGIFTKGVDADAWSVIFWRGVFAAPLVMAWLVARNGRQELTAIFRLGTVGWVAATVSSLATAAFLTAFKHTYIANVALIYAIVPFAAAAIAWAFTGVRTSRVVLALSAFALVGVGVMIGGGIGLGNLYGDSLAIAMMIGMATYLVMVRHYPDAPMIAAQSASALQLICVALFLSDPMSVPLHEIALLAAFGIVHAAAVIMLTLGTRLIPAAEAGFLGSLEVPLAPFFAWLILRELTPVATFAGGGIVLGAVGFHLVHEYRAGRRTSS
jgi:drug/metabolite transporter (DMT)-like permease